MRFRTPYVNVCTVTKYKVTAEGLRVKKVDGTVLDLPTSRVLWLLPLPTSAYRLGYLCNIVTQQEENKVKVVSNVPNGLAQLSSEYGTGFANPKVCLTNMEDR